MIEYDVIIIGAGPSGLMCAGNITNKKVLLLDKNDMIGGKIKVSGGGRCNILTSKSIEELLETVVSNPKFLYPTLNNYGPKDLYKYFEKNGLKLKEEKNQRIFPKDNKANSVITFFIDLLEKNNVDIINNYHVKKIEQENNLYYIDEQYYTKIIVIATGGKTFTHLGTTGDGYEFCTKLGHTIKQLYPCESPLICNDELIQSKVLQGITLNDVKMKVLVNNKVKLELQNDLLITHFGLSGPCALHVSSFIKKNLLNNKKIKVVLDLSDTIIPKRLKNLNIDVLEFNIVDTKGFKTAFLTGGGIDVREVNPRTYESKKSSNLYIIGEVLDINCYTGGNNMTVFMSQGLTVSQIINNKKELI